ncbi:MAG: DNA-formamidopyrimidine glycosylase family protein [Acidimicrobiales bacterium]
MPELPEVEALSAALGERMVGHRIASCQLASFAALKTVEPGIDELVGTTVERVERRGKFVCIESGGLWLVVHLARGGWIKWYEKVPSATPRPGRGPLALRLRLEEGSGFDVTEAGTEKRLALWVVRSPEDVPPIAGLGPDPLSPEFTVERFEALLASSSATLKIALTTQSLIAGVGNAYSDEALFRAQLSPFKKTRSLTPAEVGRLHDALVDVLSEAVERSDGLAPSELKGDKKRAMSVHGRTGETCPRCGDTVRAVAFSTKSLQYCPTCQTGGKVLADRRLSRLLK